MYKIPFIDLLESNHTFPGPYMFKVIGLAERGFAARVVAMVREELALDVDPPFFIRQKGEGKHVAVTLEPSVRDAQQVIDIYKKLSTMEGLVMLW